MITFKSVALFVKQKYKEHLNDGDYNGNDNRLNDNGAKTSSIITHPRCKMKRSLDVQKKLTDVFKNMNIFAQFNIQTWHHFRMLPFNIKSKEQHSVFF